MDISAGRDCPAVEIKVGSVITRLKIEGWYVARRVGSHRIFKHPNHPGIVVIAGKPSDTHGPGNLEGHQETGRLEMKYAVIIKKGTRNFSGYVPDLPTILVTGKTLRQTQTRARRAIELYLDELRESGRRAPKPTTYAAQI
ncbi:MAG: type II toxin-antitoxin system HicA family toxin [Candidatus Baltobacteraceae bacterium]